MFDQRQANLVLFKFYFVYQVIFPKMSYSRPIFVFALQSTVQKNSNRAIFQVT